jgi:hypothetical protein
LLARVERLVRTFFLTGAFFAAAAAAGADAFAFGFALTFAAFDFGFGLDAGGAIDRFGFGFETITFFALGGTAARVVAFRFDARCAFFSDTVAAAAAVAEVELEDRLRFDFDGDLFFIARFDFGGATVLTTFTAFAFA